jgi:hypothetical protein
MENQLFLNLSDNVRRVVELCRALKEQRGVHSVIKLSAAGFFYTGDGDTARCNDCGLEVSNWTLDMNPFTIHSTKNPHCSFVRSIIPASSSNVSSLTSSPTATGRKRAISNEEQNSPKRRKNNLESQSNNLFEPDSFQRGRRNTFYQWPYRGTVSYERMIQAGFLSCNADDRSMCVHCDLTCEKWISGVDNPSEVHKTLSPECLYVKEKLQLGEPPPTIINNNSPMGGTTSNHGRAANSTNSLPFSAAARPLVQNQGLRTTHRPGASGPRCPSDGLPSIDKLIQVDTVWNENQFDVNKFCCKNLLDHWDPDDDPKTEDNCWFPSWADGKQLCGDALHHKIQETNREQQRQFKF